MLLVAIPINCFCRNQELIVENIFFAIRIVKIWNFLPANVVGAYSISVFVKKIMCIDFSQFLIAKVHIYIYLSLIHI